MRNQTFTFHFDAPPEVVYQACLDPGMIQKWKVPDEMVAKIHEFDARVGGKFRVSLIYNEDQGLGKSTENADTYFGYFKELIPNQKIVEVMSFETTKPEMQGEMTMTTTLSRERGGTKMVVTHENVPPGIPLEANERGWKISLGKLATLLKKPNESSKLKTVLFLTAVAFMIFSAINPKDRFTWFLESLPSIAGLGLLLYFDRKRAVTPLLYMLICVHSVVLCVGGKYTYAEVPLGFWFQEWFDLSRNHYDRLGHFFQGFVPAILAREVLLRKRVLSRGAWLSFFCICICLAFSATYEMIEWWVAALSGEAAEAFLGTQGDVWDTQWDMFLALIGAITSILCLSRTHDRQLAIS